MQAAVIFGLIVAIIYFLSNLGLNRFTEDNSCRSLKVIFRNSCIVFISVLSANFLIDFLGFAGVSVSQKGGSATAAFTTKPEF